MRRLPLLLAAGALWLFLAAIPVLADGGPHIAAVNSGTSTLTADSCAGCHRAHTAQGDYLLKAASERALCLACHGAAGNGSTIDVEFGLQYVPAVPGPAGRATVLSYNITAVAPGVITATGSNLIAGQSVDIAGLAAFGIPDGVYIVAAGPTANTFGLEGYASLPTAGSPVGATAQVTNSAGAGVILGALRDGGFLKARIEASAPARLMYQRGYEDVPTDNVAAISTRPKVPVGASEAINSAHIDLVDNPTNGIADRKTVWGKGLVNSGLGTANVSLECVDCHNPHGNGTYRILRPVPGIEADPLGSPVAVAIKAAYSAAQTIVTDGQHKLAAGDQVTISGLTSVKSITDVTLNSATINDVTLSSVNVTAVSGATFTAVGHGLSKGDNVYLSGTITGISGLPKNYVVASVPTVDTFTLTGVSGLAAQTWGASWPTVQRDLFTTAAAHGFAAGETIYVNTGTGLTAGNFTIASVPTTTTFTLKLPAAPVASAPAISVAATDNVFTTSAAHGFAAGMTVAVASGITGLTAGNYTVGILPTAAPTTTFTLVNQTTLAAQSSLAVSATANLNGTFYVSAVTNGFTFKVASSLASVGTALTPPDFTGTASVVRPQIPVADSPIDPDNNGIYPVKNYTILQTKGLQGANKTFLLYARDVLNARTASGVAAAQPAVTISGVAVASFIDLIKVDGAGLWTTASAHGLSANGVVFLKDAGGQLGGTGCGAGQYVVATVPSTTTFTLMSSVPAGYGFPAGSLTCGSTTLTNFTSAFPTVNAPGYFQTSGTVTANVGGGHGLAVGDLVTFPSGSWTSQGFAPASSSTQYTIASVSSSGKTDGSWNSYYDRFTLVGAWISDSATSSAGSVVRAGIAGDYGATGGDYFHRTVPWNPNENNANCITVYANPGVTADISAACGVMNDAPNGRPAAISSGTTAPGSLVGQQAFNDQISTWCSQCHTRYYSNTNENVGLLDQISVPNGKIGRTMTTGEIFPILYAQVNGQYSGPAYGDKVKFSVGTGAIVANTDYYVISTGTLGGRSFFKVSATFGGTALLPNNGGSSPWSSVINLSGTDLTFTRTYQSSQSSWGFPSQDNIYKYQHQTTTNRACTTCHVAHGSNAAMPGTFSSNVDYPDGSPGGTSSRLLKIDNRGTCQMCHDPTATLAAGVYLPAGKTITTATASNDRFTTGTAHGFAVNDYVYVQGVAGAGDSLANGIYLYVKTVVSTTVVELSASQGGAIYDVTLDGTGGTIVKPAMNP